MKPSERMDFYVYGLFALSDKAFEFPKYIGKGRGVRAFCLSHLRTAPVRQWIDEMGEEPHFDLLACNILEVESFDIERALIASYGRRGIDPGGVLLNVYAGEFGACGAKRSAGYRAWRQAQ
jgi:hypothetical protein